MAIIVSHSDTSIYGNHARLFHYRASLHGALLVCCACLETALPVAWCPCGDCREVNRAG
jgi:hypothetical protein